MYTKSKSVVLTLGIVFVLVAAQFALNFPFGTSRRNGRLAGASGRRSIGWSLRQMRSPRKSASSLEARG